MRNVLLSTLTGLTSKCGRLILQSGVGYCPAFQAWLGGGRGEGGGGGGDMGNQFAQ